MENIDIANRSVVDVRREAVAFHEDKLAGVKRQRDTVLIDKRVAEARADKGDRQARMDVARLGKQDLELGRLVISIERQLKEAKKWLAFAENQAAGAAAARASVDDAALVRDKLFAVKCPDGRVVRHRHHSLEALRRELQPGYRAIGQVFGANEDDTGGFVADRHNDMMQAMLDAYGDTLLAWLTERGIVGADKTVVVLPSNGRDKMQ
jgi:hypothetical protein